MSKSKDIIGEKIVKKIIPVSVSKAVISILENIFDKMNEFIGIHYSSIVGKSNQVKLLSEIESEFNIIALLNNITQFSNDEYNLKSFKEDQFLSFMSRESIIKINQREIIHLYTLFIIMLCNICVKMVTSTRKKFTLTMKQLYSYFNIFSTFRNCELIDKIGIQDI